MNKYLTVCTLLGACTLARAEGPLKFDFGSGPVSPGYTQVTKANVYDDQKGFGFVDASQVEDVSRPGADPLKSDFSTSQQPFTFAVKLPEGNYNVTATLGDPSEDSETTVKAESRELMLENVKAAKGTPQTRTFTVNVRTPKLPDGRQVGLKPGEAGPPLVAHWDDRLTLEFSGKHPAVDAIEITPDPKAITLFIAGDSTVTQQPREPWAGWGQMLPRFFAPGVAIANHAESGLALFSFKSQRRLDKILSAMKSGDYLFIQFGHNDQKDKSPNAGPYTTYKDNLRYYVEETKKKGGLPVIVTSMERRRFSADGKSQSTLADYAEAARQIAQEQSIPVIDLNAMSLKFYQALGPENSTKAFVHYPMGTFPGQQKELKDDTHHNVYGAYELAKCVAEGIKSQVPALAKYLIPSLPTFDPSHPDTVESVKIPQSGTASVEKPAGN